MRASSDLRFPQQPAVVNDPEQQTGQHQPNRNLRVDAWTTVVRAIALRHFLVQPPGRAPRRSFPGRWRSCATTRRGAPSAMIATTSSPPAPGTTGGRMSQPPAPGRRCGRPRDQSSRGKSDIGGCLRDVVDRVVRLRGDLPAVRVPDQRKVGDVGRATVRGQSRQTLTIPRQIRQVFHQRVSLEWIAAALALTLRKLDSILRFEYRNLFFRLHNLH